MLRKRELSPFVRESLDNLIVAIALKGKFPKNLGTPFSWAVRILFRGMMKKVRQGVYCKHRTRIRFWEKQFLNIISNMTEV